MSWHFISLHFKQNDLFAHFTTLSRSGSLPSFEELEVIAKKLYRAYSSNRAVERAQYSSDPAGGFPPDEWEQTVPVGDPWHSPEGLCTENRMPQASAAPFPSLPQAVPSSTWQAAPSAMPQASSSPIPQASQPTSDSRHKTKAKGSGSGDAAVKSSSSTTEKMSNSTVFNGDQVLSNSIAFMRDTWVSREFLYAVAEGDVGRVYEAMKVSNIQAPTSQPADYWADDALDVCGVVTYKIHRISARVHMLS